MSNDIARASAAQALLDDPLLIEVLDSVESDAIKVWRTTGMADQDTRERAYHALKASERVRACLQGIVDNGLIASHRVSAGR